LLEFAQKLENAVGVTVQIFVGKIGVDFEAFGGADFVVGRELCGWRADLVAQADSHVNLGANARGEMLDIDVAQSGEKLSFALVQRVAPAEVIADFGEWIALWANEIHQVSRVKWILSFVQLTPIERIDKQS
jgi:hypothetical protein